MKVNRCLIDEAIAGGYEKELAIFIRFKSKFVNSCIYKYTQQSLADKTGYSLTFIQNHFSFFIKKGWAVYRGENLMLVKLSKIDEDNKKKILIDINQTRTIKEILEQIQYEYLKYKADQAKWYSETCRDLNKMTKSERNRIEKKISSRCENFRLSAKTHFGESGNNKFRVSIKKIAKWFKCSTGKAHGIIKSLCQRGFLDYITMYVTTKVKNVYEAKERLRNSKGSFYTSRGYVCKVLCNEYVFR